MGKGGVRTSAFTYFWLYLVIGDCQYQFQFGDTHSNYCDMMFEINDKIFVIVYSSQQLLAPRI